MSLDFAVSNNIDMSPFGNTVYKLTKTQSYLSLFAIMLFLLLSLTIPSLLLPKQQIYKSDAASPAQTSGVYPYGNEFGLGLYAIYDWWDTAAANGWNICHSYLSNWPDITFINNCTNAGMLAMGRLDAAGPHSNGNYSAKSESNVAGDINSMTPTDNISFWDIPEEMRYWKTSEMDVVQKYTAWTRKYDPKKLPNYMYIPGHYDASAIQNYVSYLDLIPASAYPTYMGQPHTYVRWSIERTYQAIANAGYSLGKDYLNGEKTVMSILELFEDNSGMTPEGSWHDFWLSVALDVKGIMVYAYYYRNDSTNLQNCWNILTDAAGKFSGTEHLDKVILEGIKDNNISFTVTSGPSRTAQFMPPDGTTIDYPPLTVLGKTWNGNTYVFAVNSDTSFVTANITGISGSGSTASVLFENRSLPVDNGSLSDTFDGLGVHIYKVGGSATDTPTPLPSTTFSPTPPTSTSSPTPIIDTTPPSVTITYPANNSTVSRNYDINITANASDNIAVTKIEFSVNNSLKCTDAATPYSCAWRVPNIKNTSYTISAKAYDAKRNTNTSTITVTAK